MKKTIKLINIMGATLFALIIGFNVVSSNFDNKAAIKDVNREMTKIQIDLAKTNDKLLLLTSQRSEINRKIGLVENHIEVQKEALNELSKELDELVGFTKAKK